MTTTWQRYVRRLAGDDNQRAIETQTGIDQGTVSRWLRGSTPSPAHAAKFAQSYDGNVLEAFVAAGFLTEEEAGVPPQPKQTFAEMVDDDPELSPEAKIHLKNQYGLLRAASAQARSRQLRNEIAHMATIDEETRARLLDALDGNLTVLTADENARFHRPVVEGAFVQRAARAMTGHEQESYPGGGVDFVFDEPEFAAE